jgi:hypothetical protein
MRRASTRALRSAQKKPALPWTTFVRAHMESMIACDFFTKTVLTARGPRTAYVLMVIHLGSRRVYCSAPTYAPDSAWVTQQARNTLMWCANQGIAPGFLIRDADTKFSASFDTVWASEGARVIQIPHRAPTPMPSRNPSSRPSSANVWISSSASAGRSSITSCGPGCAITTPSARIVGGASATTCCKSISGPPVTARSAATASLAASSHLTPATRRECQGRAKDPQGVTELISFCRVSLHPIELHDNNALGLAYTLAPLSGKAKGAGRSTGPRRAELQSRSDPFGPPDCAKLSRRAAARYTPEIMARKHHGVDVRCSVQ